MANWDNGLVDNQSSPPQTAVLPAYLYMQYRDDLNLQAMVAVYNDLSQQFIDWFNEVPLSVYTNENIAGLLLDWIGAGLYGIQRPNIELDPYGDITSDDLYKRVLTWHQWAADGRQMSVSWLRRRIARFVYGVDGADVWPDKCYNINISFSTYSVPILETMFPVADDVVTAIEQVDEVELTLCTITLPVNDEGAYAFAQCAKSGLLALPLQMRFNYVFA